MGRLCGYIYRRVIFRNLHFRIVLIFSKMVLPLPVTALIAFAITLLAYRTRAKTWKEALLAAVILWGFLLVLGTIGFIVSRFY
jgi:hypothetical protein